MIHWRDAQRYIEQHGSIDDGYIEAIREESLKQLENVGINDYNVHKISDYALTTYLKGFYDETWTEYRVRQILKGK